MTDQPLRIHPRIPVIIIVAASIIEALNDLLRADSPFAFLRSKYTPVENLPYASVYIAVLGLVTLVTVIVFLRLTGESFADVGFRKEGRLRSIGTGALFGLGIFVFNTFLLSPVLQQVMPASHVSNAALFGTMTNIAILFILGILKGGFVEELWRIFVLTRFEKLLGKAGLVIALILTTVLFGLGHAYQGNTAIVGTAVVGFLNALVYLRKGNAFEAVAAHATYDIIAVLLGAVLYYGE
jgi:uncharacterized protein